MSSNFKESWLIPKEDILDYWEFKGTQKEEEQQEEQTKEQRGGNALLKNLYQYKPSKRLRIAKFYDRADRIRTSNRPVPPLQPPTPVFNDPNTARNTLMIEKILPWFPEAERYKVMSLLNYINQYLLYRFSVNSYLNIVIDKQNFENSSVVDILKYLYAIERRYVTEHKIVVDPNTGQRYGIPLGTEQFVAMLKTAQKNLKVFGVSGHRLRLLNTGTTTLELSDDEHSDNDFGVGGGGGGGDGGGGKTKEQTPFEKAKRGKQRRKLEYPTFIPMAREEQPSMEDYMEDFAANFDTSMENKDMDTSLETPFKTPMHHNPASEKTPSMSELIRQARDRQATQELQAETASPQAAARGTPQASPQAARRTPQASPEQATPRPSTSSTPQAPAAAMSLDQLAEVDNSQLLAELQGASSSQLPAYVPADPFSPKPLRDPQNPPEDIGGDMEDLFSPKHKNLRKAPKRTSFYTPR